jgi:hypothetical protein
MPSLRVLLFGFAALACSSSPNDDEQPGGATGLDTSVYDHCVDFATQLCRDSENCCQTAYDGFELDACITTFKHDVCRPAADAVTAGRATFDEDAVDDCVAAHAEAHAICIPTWKQTIALRKRIYSACRVINGTTPPGNSCTISATCKHPEGEATVECVKNVCQVIEVLPEGATCPFPSGSVSVCDDGLACDAPGLGATGQCVRAPSSGDACDASSLESTACGLGSYCDGASETCKLADNFGGSGCSQGTECVSFECDRIGNECAAAPAVVSRATCLGAPQTP